MPVLFHTLELVAGTLSMLGTAAMIATFIKVDRRYPASIVLIISVLDFFLAFKFMLRASAWISDPTDNDGDSSFHLLRDSCLTSIIWSGFFETATMAWNSVWCLNLMLQLHHPQTQTSTWCKVGYHVYTWGAAITMAVLQTSTTSYGQTHAGTYSYCTVLPRSFSNPAFTIDYIFALVQIIIAAVSLMYARHRLKQGLEHSRRLLFYHALYTSVFVLLWGLERNLVWKKNLALAEHQTVALLWQSQGFFLAIIRLSELEVRQLWRRSRQGYQNMQDDELQYITGTHTSVSTLGPNQDVTAELAVQDAFGLSPARMRFTSMASSPGLGASPNLGDW